VCFNCASSRHRALLPPYNRFPLQSRRAVPHPRVSIKEQSNTVEKFILGFAGTVHDMPDFTDGWLTRETACGRGTQRTPVITQLQRPQCAGHEISTSPAIFEGDFHRDHSSTTDSTIKTPPKKYQHRLVLITYLIINKKTAYMF